MGMCESRSFATLDAYDDIERILAEKPEYLKNDDFLDNLYLELAEQSLERRPTISLIQFTDVHLDLDYVVGSNILCNNMLCCRHEDGYPDDPEL